jgi:hypothetical protein
VDHAQLRVGVGEGHALDLLMAQAARLLLACAALSACQFRFDRALEPGQIRGRVFYEQPGTGERKPAAGARLRLLGTTRGALADAEGAFLFRDVPVGTHTVLARFELPVDATPRPVAELVVPGVPIKARPTTAGRKRQGHDVGSLTVNALGEVRGRVARGALGVAGARVVAQGFGAAQTGPDGRYAMKLPRGSFELVALYPDGAETRVTRPLQLAVRGVAEVDFTAAAEDRATGSLHGEALVESDDDAIDFSGTRVRLRAADGTEPTLPVATDAQGRYTVENAPAGVYTLVAQAPGRLDAHLGPVAVFPGATAPLMVLAAAGDCDRDGVPDETDLDDDEDGVADTAEDAACACDPSGASDAGGNGICDGAEAPAAAPPCPTRCGPGEACAGGACWVVSPTCSPACAAEQACLEGACVDAPASDCGICPDAASCVLGSCLADADGDRIADALDLCPALAGAPQTDADRDRIGDACDLRPSRADLAVAGGAPIAVSDRARTSTLRVLGSAGAWAQPAVLGGAEHTLRSGPSALGGATAR